MSQIEEPVPSSDSDDETIDSLSDDSLDTVAGGTGLNPQPFPPKQS